MTSSRALLFLITFSIKRDWAGKKKTKFTFLKVFNNPLSEYLIFKRISCMQWLFWAVCQNKKGSRTSFWCIFSAWSFHKNVPYLIMYQWPKFQYHTFFPSRDTKQNVLLSSCLGSWWCHKIQDLSWIELSSNGWQGEQEGKMEIQKFEYLEKEKSFLDEIKNIFHSFWRAIVWWKIKKKKKK